MSARRYHHGNLATALLDAAEEIIEEQGLAGLTLRACARRAGVSHAAPKHHFGDIRGVLRGVAERGFALLVERLEAAIKPVVGDLDEEFYACCRAYVEFAGSYPEHFRLMFRADLTEFPETPTVVERTLTVLTNVIRRQRGEHDLENSLDVPNREDLLNDILIGWSQVHGHAHLKLEGQLAMVPADCHEQHMRQASQRIAKLLRLRT